MAENVARASSRAQGQPSGLSGWLHSHLQTGPAKYVGPRVVFAAVALGLTAFGVMLAYSSTSMDGFMGATFDPQGMFLRQALGAVVGIVLAILLAFFARYDIVTRNRALVIYAAIALVLLLLTRLGLGETTANDMGATRSLKIPGLPAFQPTELVKPLFVLTAATLIDRYFTKRDIDAREFLELGILCFLLPLALVLIQPDKGTTIITLMTVWVLLFMVGFNRVILWVSAILGVVGFAILSMFTDYARARILVLFCDFWSTENLQNLSFQLARGLGAFATGGMWGQGIGMSKMKYGHLPMANSDLVFAVVGEETGFVGCVIVIAAFCLLFWAGMKIADNAPDNRSRLIAAGGTLMLTIQALVNMCGVLVFTPLTGKPLPFLTYGGSAIVGVLLIVGMVLSVSHSSKEPETEYDRRRADFTVTSSAGTFGEGVGEPTLRSERPSGPSAYASTPLAGSRTRSSRLTVVDGGADDRGRGSSRNTGPTSPEALRRERERREARGGRGRTSVDASTGRERIDLGPDAGERLRSRRDGRRDR